MEGRKEKAGDHNITSIVALKHQWNSLITNDVA